MRPDPPEVRLMTADLVRSVSRVMLPVTPEMTAPPKPFSRTDADPEIVSGTASAVTGVRASIAMADAVATVLHAKVRRRKTLNLKIPFLISGFSYQNFVLSILKLDAEIKFAIAVVFVVAVDHRHRDVSANLAVLRKGETEAGPE